MRIYEKVLISLLSVMAVSVWATVTFIMRKEGWFGEDVSRLISFAGSFIVGLFAGHQLKKK